MLGEPQEWIRSIQGSQWSLTVNKGLGNNGSVSRATIAKWAQTNLNHWTLRFFFLPPSHWHLHLLLHLCACAFSRSFQSHPSFLSRSCFPLLLQHVPLLAFMFPLTVWASKPLLSSSMTYAGKSKFLVPLSLWLNIPVFRWSHLKHVLQTHRFFPHRELSFRFDGQQSEMNKKWNSWISESGLKYIILSIKLCYNPHQKEENHLKTIQEM